MIRFFQVLIILFTLSFISCGDNNFLMTLSDSEDAVTIKISIDSGVVLDPDLKESIDISLEYDETVVIPEKLEISFLDKQGLEIGETQIIEGDSLNKPLPSISLASPLESRYSIRLRVFDNDDIIIKEEIVSFFYSREDLSIRGLTPYPNVFAPGGQGLIFIDADGSDESWIRWSIDNEIIEEGYFGNYEEGFIWQAPLLEGVYGLRMELFPEEPLYTKNGTYSFISPLKSELEIFVTSMSENNPMDLYPPESYSTLIHFTGLVVDEGTNFNNIDTVGFPVIKRQENKLGYYLQDNSGFILDGNILPVVDNKLMPFSLTFVHCIDSPQIDTSFLNIADEQDSIFSIKSDSSGFFVLELFQLNESVKHTTKISPEKYNEITLSVIPVDNSITFLWYGDGILLSTNNYNFINEIPNGSFKTIISGENGFEGLLDEFGVFTKDEKARNNIDNFIFNRKIFRESHNPDKIIAAYGFDGLFLDNSSLETSLWNVIVDYKSILNFLETDFSFSYLYIDIDFEEISKDTELHIIFPDTEGEEDIKIDIENLFPTDTKNNKFALELNVDESILTVLSNGKTVAEASFETHNPAVFQIINNSEGFLTKIKSILVKREEKRVVEDSQLDIDTRL
jgi:hypothetical protein